MSYRVWLAEETDDEGKTYPRVPSSSSADIDSWATSESEAVRLYAEHCHNQRDGWEWSWPIEFLVRDEETKKVLLFDVERETVPEFWCGRGVEMEPGPHDRAECDCGHPFGSNPVCAKCPCGRTP